jgi:outer membrane biosynthesis protein TonB
MKIDVNTPKILFSGVVSVLLLVLIIVGVNAWFLRYEEAELETKWDMAPNTMLADTRDAQVKQISTAGKNRDNDKKLTIPISQAAMLLVQSGGKMPATQPSAAPAATAPTAPAADAPKTEPAKPESAKPEEKKPDAPKSEEKKSDEKKPAETKPDEKNPEEKKPE